MSIADLQSQLDQLRAEQDEIRATRVQTQRYRQGSLAPQPGPDPNDLAERMAETAESGADTPMNETPIGEKELTGAFSDLEGYGPGTYSCRVSLDGGATWSDWQAFESDSAVDAWSVVQMQSMGASSAGYHVALEMRAGSKKIARLVDGGDATV